jgi:hypothetical protein
MPVGAMFLFSKNVQISSGAYPACMFNGYWGSFLGVKRPGQQVYHSRRPRTNIKNEYIYTSTSPIYAFMAWTAKTLPCTFYSYIQNGLTSAYCITSVMLFPVKNYYLI